MGDAASGRRIHKTDTRRRYLVGPVGSLREWRFGDDSNTHSALEALRELRLRREREREAVASS